MFLDFSTTLYFRNLLQVLIIFTGFVGVYHLLWPVVPYIICDALLYVTLWGSTFLYVVFKFTFIVFLCGLSALGITSWKETLLFLGMC